MHSVDGDMECKKVAVKLSRGPSVLIEFKPLWLVVRQCLRPGLITRLLFNCRYFPNVNGEKDRTATRTSFLRCCARVGVPIYLPRSGIKEAGDGICKGISAVGRQTPGIRWGRSEDITTKYRNKCPRHHSTYLYILFIDKHSEIVS